MLFVALCCEMRPVAALILAFCALVRVERSAAAPGCRATLQVLRGAAWACRVRPSGTDPGLGEIACSFASSFRQLPSSFARRRTIVGALATRANQKPGRYVTGLCLRADTDMFRRRRTLRRATRGAASYYVLRCLQAPRSGLRHQRRNRSGWFAAMACLGCARWRCRSRRGCGRRRGRRSYGCGRPTCCTARLPQAGAGQRCGWCRERCGGCCGCGSRRCW